MPAILSHRTKILLTLTHLAHPLLIWNPKKRSTKEVEVHSISTWPHPNKLASNLSETGFFFYPSRGACTKEHADHSQGNDLGPKQTCAIHSDKKTPRRLTQTVTRNTIKKDPLALKGTCFGGDPVFRNSGKWRLSPGSSANHVIILVSVSWEGNQF